MAKITYGDELPDDSVGKKFQGAVYDTGSANAIAAVKGVNPVTQQGKTVVDQSVAVTTASGAGAAGGLAADAAVTTDATGTRSAYLRGIVAWFARLGALDGAAFTAGSSYVWPGLAGVYQSTVDVLTAGQRGLARLTSRRAVLVAGDYRSDTLRTSDITSGTDILGNTTGLVPGATLTGAFFDGTDVGFGAAARYVYIPVSDWKNITIGIVHSLGVDVTLQVSGLMGGSGGHNLTGGANVVLYTSVIATGSELFLGATAAGTGAGAAWVSVPAFSNPPFKYLSLKFTPASDPASGELRVFVDRRSS